MTYIDIYDTTLRDGTQSEGFTLSGNDKIRIAQKLDELGVAFIEGGWPGSNPKDAEFFEERAVLFVAEGISAFDIIDAEVVEPARDQQLVRR